jgi:hypothetical protein
MQQSLKELLVDRKADTDTIQQATLYYLAERTDDLSPEEMRQQLIAAVGDANKVDSALRTLENDPLLRENASLAVLSFAWEEPGEAERVQSSIDAARTQLPVIELAILAIVAMYGMYLVATGGKEAEKTRTIRKPDGSLVEEKDTKWVPPTGPLNAIVSLFPGVKQQSDKDKKAE